MNCVKLGPFYYFPSILTIIKCYSGYLAIIFYYLSYFYRLFPLSSFILFLGSFFLGATGPLFYELSVELTYPMSEGTSAGLLTLVNNIACLVFLGAAPFIPPSVVR